MINIFRTFAGSYIAKILLALVVLSFVIAGGIGANSLSNRNVASVGDLKISTSNFYNEYQSRVKSMNLMAYSKADLRQIDFARSVLNGMIAKKLIRTEANTLNLTISDAFLANKIKSTEYFQKDGVFDKATFKSVLSSNGFNENSYVSLTESYMIEERYTSFITAINFVPKNLNSLISRAKEQKRSGIKATKNIKSLKVASAKNAVLQKYYTDNAEDFRVLEMRDTTALTLSVDTLKNSITNSEIDENYATNKESYRTVEKRSYYYFTGQKENLQKLVQAVKSKANLSESVNSILKKPLSTYLKVSVSKSEIPAYIAKSVFTTKKEAFSKIEAGAFATSVVWVKSISPSKVPSLLAMKDQIKSFLAEEKLLDAINIAEDQISAGSTLAEISKKLNIKTEPVLNVSVNGGQSGYRKNTNFVKEAFQLQIGETSMPVELSDNEYVFLSLDTIKPTHIPKFKVIKNKVKSAYEKKMASILLMEQLNTLNTMKSASKFKSKAKKLGFKLINIKSLSREKAYESEINAILFENALNTSDSTIIKSIGYSVFTTNIDTPKNASKEEIESTQTLLRDITTSSIYKDILYSLRKKHTVDINTSALNSVYK